MNFEDNMEVEMFLFEDEEGKNLRLVFSGNARDLRKVNKGWDGFELGERFTLEDEEVRVYKKRTFWKDQDSIPKHTYYVGPIGLNANKISFDEVN